MSAEIGAIVPGTVVRLAPYGAFIKLESGETGLVHISEIDRNYVRSVEEHLRLDDVVTVKVVGMKDDGKIDLSIKQAATDWQPEAPRRRAARDTEYDQELQRFMRSSEERLVAVNRQRAGRRACRRGPQACPPTPPRPVRSGEPRRLPIVPCCTGTTASQT